jgi:hypothetical protein
MMVTAFALGSRLRGNDAKIKSEPGLVLAKRSNPHPVTHSDGDCSHAPELGRGVAALLTRNRAAVSFSVIPAKAGTQGERT